MTPIGPDVHHQEARDVMGRRATPMKAFQCDVLGHDGHVSRSVQFLASDGDIAKSEAARLFTWLAPRDRGGGLILRDGATVLLRLEATR